MDVPAGDIGVGGREIGYLFGQYKRIRGAYENGDAHRQGHVLRRQPDPSRGHRLWRHLLCMRSAGAREDTIAGKTIAISGFGNVAWGVATKAAQLGAKVITLAGPDGYIYDAEGVTTQEKLDYMLTMRNSGRNKVQDYADKFGVPFFPGQKPWGQKADICMPCAYQNEIGMKEAEQILANGTKKYYIEVANMPTTNEALYFLMGKGLIVAPSKAVNAGGVSVSGLEMSQNSERLAWRAPKRWISSCIPS